ncbi:hypothetical protein DEO72_LG5g1841 [Vigna unguiculata]|uniref:Uncharacterized protein n=1 Tax=Vigna unguiculata TaxID=3917 RepID=A0A4D6LYD8_VIGUN|nr:hypothetical protein DEO72_LG5g1841 [Vigna unguiculata]
MLPTPITAEGAASVNVTVSLSFPFASECSFDLIFTHKHETLLPLIATRSVVVIHGAPTPSFFFLRRPHQTRNKTRYLLSHPLHTVISFHHTGIAKLSNLRANLSCKKGDFGTYYEMGYPDFAVVGEKVECFCLFN